MIAPDLAGPMPALCFPTDWGCIGSAVAQSAFEGIVKALGAGVVTMVKFMSSFWFAIPSPVVATGDGGSWALSPAIAQINAWTAPMTAAIAIISFSIAIGRIAFSGNGGEVRGIVRQMAAVGAGTLVVVATAQLLIRAGDAFSPWIIEQASAGGDPSSGLEKLISAGLQNGEPTASLGLWFLVFILCGLGSIVQCVFMLIRGAALYVLMAFVAPTAASAASEEGWLRFKRLGLLIIGFALYKPVAAIIYAVGILEMTRNTSDGNDVQNAMYGLTIVVMAALALPAFIKFLMPAAAIGSSSAFSGAAAVGVVAAGAAVVATGGWGAAGAAAGSGSAGGAGAAGAVGASGAAGSAGPAGGADTAPPPPPPPPAPAPAGGSGGSRSWGAGLATVGAAGAGQMNAAAPQDETA